MHGQKQNCLIKDDLFTRKLYIYLKCKFTQFTYMYDSNKLLCLLMRFGHYICFVHTE